MAPKEIYILEIIAWQFGIMNSSLDSVYIIWRKLLGEDALAFHDNNRIEQVIYKITYRFHLETASLKYYQKKKIMFVKVFTDSK